MLLQTGRRTETGCCAAPAAAPGASGVPGRGETGRVPGSDYGEGGLARVFHSRLLQPIAACEAEKAFEILSASGEQG